MGERYYNWDTPGHELTEGRNGAEFVLCGTLAMGPIYNDGLYKYFGEAVPGTALTTAEWRVSRMKIADKQVDWADGNGLFDNVFTDVATVAGLTYE